MAGNGGATAVATHMDAAIDSWGLIIKAATSDGKNWQGDDDSLLVYGGQDEAGDYYLNPSVVRFIIDKGMTDAGGNPFEGVSAYDPGDDLANMETRLEAFITLLSEVDPTENWATYLAEAVADLATVVPELDIDAIFAEVASTATSRANGAVSSALASAKSYSETMADDVNVRADIRAENLVLSALNIARSGASSALTDAIAAGASAIDSGAVTDAVSSYRTRALPTHLRSVNRLAAGMSDINAVNSSAFIIGMSLMETDYDRNVSDYQARLELNLYAQGMTLFMQAFIETLNRRVSAAATEAAWEMQAYQFAGGQWLAAFYNILSPQLSQHIRTRLQEKLQKSGYLEYATGKLLERDVLQLDGTRVAATLQSELSRNTIASRMDEYQADLEYDVKNGLWDMELFQQGANIVGATTGAIVPSAGKSDRVQSSMAGAAAGAGIGLQVGSKGDGPWGAGIGAAVGGLLGGVAGYQP